MSAYLTDAEKVGLIAVAAVHGYRHYEEREYLEMLYRAGYTLMQANLDSLAARYPADEYESRGEDIAQRNNSILAAWTDPADYQCTLGATLQHLASKQDLLGWSKLRREVVEAVAEYRYQSCEHDSWQGSEADLISLTASHAAAIAQVRADSWI